MTNTRIVNFSAGPAVLPEAVLETAASEMTNYRGSGMSVMEMSHRSSHYKAIIDAAEADLRTLMGIPDNYKVLFLQGGATLQFSMVPMNLLKNGKADYIITGSWAQKAYKEARKYGDIKVAASSEADGFKRIPDLDGVTFRADADYVHICDNNTIAGTVYKTLPDTKGIPLVSDMSSSILSRPIDVSKYGLIYAGAQKNVGPAGVTIVIVREDLIREDLDPTMPLMLRYDTHAKAASMHNTPPTYAIYVCGLVFKWLLDMGGIPVIEKVNRKKADALYAFLDRSSMFKGTVHPDHRSIMNVCFTTGDEEQDARFIKASKEAGFENLKGHRSVGGMRASIYNAMPYDGVMKLIGFMEDYEARERTA